MLISVLLYWEADLIQRINLLLLCLHLVSLCQILISNCTQWFMFLLLYEYCNLWLLFYVDLILKSWLLLAWNIGELVVFMSDSEHLKIIASRYAISAALDNGKDRSFCFVDFVNRLQYTVSQYTGTLSRYT